MKVSPDRLSTLLGPWAVGAGPLYDRLARALAACIDRGELGVGAVLPTERDLARRLEVSRTTVVGAYGELKDAGRLDSRQGRGTWVRASDAPPSGERPFSAELYSGLLRQDDGMIELTAACPPPTSVVSRVLDEMSSEGLADVVSGTGYLPAGLPELRRQVAALMTAEGVPTRSDEILITTGAQQAIGLVTTLLGEPGSPVLTEEVTYPGALDVVRGSGMRPIGVALDERGIVPEALEDLLERVRPRFVYLVPAHQNPTGSVLSERRSRLVAELAARSRVPVVEDLALRRLLLGDRRPLPAPIAAHAPETVISIGSVSKVLWAGLRIGWIRAPHPVVERLTRLKIAADMGTSVLSQHLAARLLPSIDEATEERRRHLVTGYEALSASLEEHLPEWTWDPPRGGCTLWVRLPSGDARAFGQVAQRCGVNVVPGQVLSAEGGHGDRLRLPFVYEPPVIAEAVRRMAVAWDLYAGRGSQVEREESLIV